jgi:hypothetical protein
VTESTEEKINEPSSAMTPERIAEIERRAELRRSITEGPNALIRALASADDVPDLLAEVERLASELDWKHSQLMTVGEVAKSNKRVTESYAAEVERVTRERDRLRVELEDAERTRGDILAACCWDDGEDREEVPTEEIRDIFARADGRLHQRADGNAPTESPAAQPTTSEE